jgi:hypothetical protein
LFIISFLLIDFVYWTILFVPLKYSAVGMRIPQASLYHWLRDISGGVLTRLWAGSPKNRDSIPDRDKGFIPRSVQVGPGVHVIMFNLLKPIGFFTYHQV